MAPAPEQCAEREKIAHAIRTVMSQILSLHAEAEALNKPFQKRDFDEMERVDKELQNAQARESSLLDTLHAHIQSHGCQRYKVLE